MVWMLTMTIVRNLHFCEPTFSWKLTALHVRRDACILLWGEALRPPPNPPPPLFYLNPSYISWGWQVAIFANELFSWKLTATLHVRRGAFIKLSGEALRPSPNPPSHFFIYFIFKPKLVNTLGLAWWCGEHDGVNANHDHRPQLAFLRTNLLLKADSITCEKRCLHSALGGRRYALPPIPSPAFYI